MQGDWHSAILFIFYLGKALSTSTIKIEADNRGIFYLEPKYADDITAAAINDDGTLMRRIDSEYPEKLKEYHLKQNETKTENHNVPPKTIQLPPNPNTKKVTWSDLDWALPDSKT